MNTLIPYPEVTSKIVTIRKHDVIADADVAELYGVETRRINEAVKNNLDKFPDDYMFELTKNELRSLRSKNSTTKVSFKSRSATKVFTEKGLYMLATILKSERATTVTFFLTESSLELNFIIGKIKHTVKRVKKEK